MCLSICGDSSGDPMLDGSFSLSRNTRTKRERKKMCVPETLYFFSFASRLRLKRLSVSLFSDVFSKLSFMWWTHKRGIVFSRSPPVAVVMHKFDPCWYADLQKCKIKKTLIITKGQTQLRISTKSNKVLLGGERSEKLKLCFLVDS